MWSQVKEASHGQEEKHFSLCNRMREGSTNVDRDRFANVESKS